MMRLIYIAAALTIFVPDSQASAAPVSPAIHRAAMPDLAINERGDIAVLWVDLTPDDDTTNQGRDDRLSYVDLHVAVSRDGGATFAPPVKVNRTAGLVRALTVNRPRIAAGRGSIWHVQYSANEIHPTRDKTMLSTHVTRSIDGGATFEPSRRISGLLDVDMSEAVHIHGGYMSAQSFGTIAAAADGGVHVMWVDSRTQVPGSDVRSLYVASSRDDGATFAAERQMLATNVCPCCQMMAAVSQQSDVYLSLRMVGPDGSRQASIARLDVASGLVLKPVDTGGARWVIDGCPMKAAALAAQGASVFTAVHDGGATSPGVAFSFFHDRGVSFSTATAAYPEADVSDAPSIAVNNTRVLVAWHGKTTGSRRVFYRMYDLDGRPAGSIVELSAAPDPAQTPVVAARRDGRFQIAWQQADRIFTTIVPADAPN